MSLSLIAEQKELLKLFNISEQYVIPSYQRPYSWEYDHCLQLHTDIYEAYKSKEDYFIGNIIIAKSETNKEILEVIDGQQRLITLLLFIKIFSLLVPEFKILLTLLQQENWEGTETKPRITSEIFESEENSFLKQVLQLTFEELKERYTFCTDRNKVINEKKCRSRFEANILHLYNWLIYLIENNQLDIRQFINFFLKNIHVLPIELTGRTRDEANEKALTIFETINDRGMNLEDADIFKAKLYKKSKKIGEEASFIDSWMFFKVNCEDLGVSIDDIFRYYSHVIRGKEGITSNEINLREFFNREQYSPFELKQYKEILSDLFKIIEILEFIKKNKFTETQTEASRWLHLIDMYTNQYPKFVLVVYLYINGFDVNSNLLTFLKSLVRYFYFIGSTTIVKFETYNMIKKISSGEEINQYCQNIDFSHFNSMGRLKYGYAFLAFYLENKSISYSANYNIDRIITLNDLKELKSIVEKESIDSLIDDIGNLIVIDIRKKHMPIYQRLNHYKESNIKELQELSTTEFSINFIKERSIRLKTILIDFFNCTI